MTDKDHAPVDVDGIDGLSSSSAPTETEQVVVLRFEYAVRFRIAEEIVAAAGIPVNGMRIHAISE